MNGLIPSYAGGNSYGNVPNARRWPNPNFQIVEDGPLTAMYQGMSKRGKLMPSGSNSLMQMIGASGNPPIEGVFEDISSNANSNPQFNFEPIKRTTSAGNPSSAAPSVTPNITGGAPKGASGLFKEGGFFTKGGGLEGMFGKLSNPQLDYNWKATVGPNGAKTPAGLQAFGKNLGGVATGLNTARQAIDIFGNLQDMGDAKDEGDDLMSEILASSYNSPTIQYDLTSDQLDLLRELRNGNYDNSLDLGDVNIGSVLGGAGKGALSGLAGGLPGVILGAIGGAGSSITENLANARDRNNTELESLYQAVLDSEQQNNAAKKQRMYQYMGL